MKYPFLLLIVLLLGCSGNKKQSSTSQSVIPVINLSEDISPVTSLSLSEAVSEVDIVPLEVTDESLLGEIRQFQVTENSIWVEPVKDQRIYHFSRSGKYLNKIGKVGQGPGEFVWISDFFVDENHKEIYIITASRGIMVYDFEGNFKKQATKTIVETMFGSLENQFLICNNQLFISQEIPLYRQIPKDSLWSFALVDSTYQKKKLFKNPAHIGREDQIIENRINMDKMVNYWKEYQISIDTYNNQLTLKYPDTDTIYCYDSEKNELLPQYAIFTNEEKGDYESTHLWFKERKAFDYFSILSYYPTKDFIYLLGSKGEDIYTYCYNKQDGSVKLQKREGKITERKVPWFSFPLRQMQRPFVLNNDLCGGNFTIDNRSVGKYWIDILEPGNDENWIDIDEVKASTVIDEAKKKEFIKVLENVNEDSNPILVIATLK